MEIIPAEIQPPARTPESASGNRIRIGTKPVTNWGDHADVVVAFNEQVLLHRHRLGALAEDAIILIDRDYRFSALGTLAGDYPGEVQATFRRWVAEAAPGNGATSLVIEN